MWEVSSVCPARGGVTIMWSVWLMVKVVDWSAGEYSVRRLLGSGGAAPGPRARRQRLMNGGRDHVHAALKEPTFAPVPWRSPDPEGRATKSEEEGS